MTPEAIADRWPHLFHMAEAGSWPMIQRYGLLSTTALLDLFEVDGSARTGLETKRRVDSVEIRHPVHGTATIRDNKPINETVLRRTLVGMSEPAWYRTLNGRVFFWLTTERLDRLRDAPPYRNRAHDILTIDTAGLLSRHGARVELAGINSGAVHPGARNSRGADTFRRIADYPWASRRSRERVVELTVPYSVPDIADHVVDVMTR
jgi:hypothetical protein